MKRSRSRIYAVLAAFALSCLAVCAHGAAGREGQTLLLLTKDGRFAEVQSDNASAQIEINGKTRSLSLGDVLTISFASTPSDRERERIVADLAVIAADKDRTSRDIACAELTDIGLPVMSPLLAAYKDTDHHEPQPLNHLFARIVAGYADSMDRSLDMVRMASGEVLRGRVEITALNARIDGADRSVSASDLRRIAVRRPSIDKTFDVDALRHTTPIDFLDAGVAVSSASKVEITARGLVRLSFDIDGWASDPDGLKIPGPNYKTNLVDGYPFGALVGRIGPTGLRWLAGRHIQKSGFQQGRLYLAVNDNGHWQNNVGSFRVRLRVTEGYDLGDPQ